jgi:hypothetical protein
MAEICKSLQSTSGRVAAGRLSSLHCNGNGQRPLVGPAVVRCDIRVFIEAILTCAYGELTASSAGVSTCAFEELTDRCIETAEPFLRGLPLP